MRILGSRYTPRVSDDYNIFSVEAILKIPPLKIEKLVIFIIDTGASQTTINVKDAIMLDDDMKKMQSALKDFPMPMNFPDLTSELMRKLMGLPPTTATTTKPRDKEEDPLK